MLINCSEIFWVRLDLHYELPQAIHNDSRQRIHCWASLREPLLWLTRKQTWTCRHSHKSSKAIHLSRYKRHTFHDLLEEIQINSEVYSTTMFGDPIERGAVQRGRQLASSWFVTKKVKKKRVRHNIPEEQQGVPRCRAKAAQHERQLAQICCLGRDTKAREAFSAEINWGTAACGSLQGWTCTLLKIYCKQRKGKKRVERWVPREPPANIAKETLPVLQNTVLTTRKEKSMQTETSQVKDSLI